MTQIVTPSTTQLPGQKFPTSPFDAIRLTRQDGTEFWSARDLQPLLGYAKWERFRETIDRALESNENAAPGTANDHFPAAGKLVEVGSGAERTVLDYHLSRHACYLIAMNGDPRKPEIAAAQLYFAVQTQRAERAQAAALAMPSDPVLAQLEMLKQVRVSQLALEERTEAIEDATAQLEKRLDDTPIRMYPQMEGRIKALCQAFGRVHPKSFAGAYHAFKEAFGFQGVPLARYDSLPAHRYQEACQWLNVQIKTFSAQRPLLDGE